jgi:hypothetical protein
MLMRRLILIIALSSLLGFNAWGGSVKPIDTMMRLRLASSNKAQDDEEDYSFPLSSRAENQEGYKSSGRAALYSLVLPGAGQYYIGGANFKAKLFFGMEAGFWLTYLGFRKYGSYKEESAKGWAVLHADANPDNNDDDYWVKMTYYDNRDRNENDGLGYNQMARVYDRNDANTFPETPLYYWNWDTRDSRQRYRNLRNQSKTAFERADVAVGVIIANHVVSAIEAFFSAGKHNRHLEFSDTGFKLKYNLTANPSNPAVTLSITKNFY